MRSHQLRDPTEERSPRCRPITAVSAGERPRGGAGHPAGVRAPPPQPPGTRVGFQVLGVWWGSRGLGRGLGPGSKCKGGPGGQCWAQGCGTVSSSGAPGPPRLHSANAPWIRGEAFRKRCLTSAMSIGSETSSASLRSTSRGRRETRSADSRDLTPQVLSACSTPPWRNPLGSSAPGGPPS